MGRSIKKGSRAIRILAPMIYKKQKEAKEVDENGDTLKDIEEKEIVFIETLH